MPVLSEAFSRKEENLPKTSFLGKLFSSPLVRGSYPDQKLEVALKIVGNDNEKKRLTYLINTIARHSVTGRKILEEAAKNDYILGFEHKFGSYGTCNSEDKILTLNPCTNDLKLFTTLAHEARHAQQHSTFGIPKMMSCDIATEVKLRRACEADAQAAAAQTALEIRASTKENIVWKTFAKAAPTIAYAVEEVAPSRTNVEAVEKQQSEIMAAAFKGWFDDARILDTYEENYLISPMMFCLCGSSNGKFYRENPFSQSMSSEQITDSLCKSASGKCYLEGEKNILDTPRMCAIFPMTKKVATAFFDQRYAEARKPVDKSFVDLPTRTEPLHLKRYRLLMGDADLKQTHDFFATLAAKKQR